MSIWQAILIGGWVLALCAGADKRLAFVMACNFAVTALWPVQIGIVGIADLASVGVLAAISRRGAVLAFLYAVCAVINALGHLGHLPTATTYAILDPIGWLMLAVLGNVDAGLRRRIGSPRRSYRRGGFGLVDFMAKRRNLVYGVAVDCGEDQR